jgi:hypothetical protein
MPVCGSGAVVSAWSLLIRRPQRACRQAETPLIVLCRFPGPVLATPWWISSFVPNLEAELGLALMFASVIPIYGRAGRGNLARLFAYTALLVFGAVTFAWWGFLAWLIWHVI